MQLSNSDRLDRTCPPPSTPQIWYKAKAIISDCQLRGKFFGYKREREPSLAHLPSTAMRYTKEDGRDVSHTNT